MKELGVEILDIASRGGAEYADVRIVRKENESITVKNTRVEALVRSETMGFGVRVLLGGVWGFACSSEMSRDEALRVTRQALEIARAGAGLAGREKVRLAPQDPIRASWKNSIEEDPFTIPPERKIPLLIEATEIMGRTGNVRVSQGFMEFWKNCKVFLSTEGSEIEQEIIECGGGISAHAMDGNDMQVRSYPNSFRGQFQTRGYELIRELELTEHAGRIAEEASRLLDAPPCPSGEYTLVLDGNQLALQIHESIGHPTELDRILGMEASFAGTSFIKPEDTGSLRYGSPVMNITADATYPGGLGSFGYDDEGVPAQRFSIVREGILEGLLTSRETATRIGPAASNGTARADGWNRIPIIRMTNINIEPGEGTLEDLIGDTDDGIFMSTNKSWSIDDKRLNFQFGCEIAREIKNGKLGRIFKNPTYTGITPEFWASLERVAGPGEWKLWGTPNCGKGQPGQTAHVGHGTSPARFRNVKVGV